MKSKLTKEQILSIPGLKDAGMSNRDVARELGIAKETVAYWIRRLRAEGFTVVNQPARGRQAIKLRD